ncbi:hypothetical protein HK104_005968, partial [Borealophlyctis nickersoniae]
MPSTLSSSPAFSPTPSILAPLLASTPSDRHPQLVRTLGASFLSQIEALRSEVDTLVGIWEEYRRETDE